MLRLRLALLTVGLVAAAASASEPEEALLFDEAAYGRVRLVPHVSAAMLGGQDRYSGRGKSIGLGSLNAAASARVDEDWAVIPSYQGYYQQTRQTLDVGERTVLVQSRMDHRLTSKLIWGGPEDRHKLKFSAGARWQLLSETKDEPWGRGLFDYRKYSGGVEWEYVIRKPYDSVRLAYDYYKIVYPNYVTLESRGLLQQNGQPIARELVGGRVLDAQVHAVLLGLSGRVGESVPWDFFYIGSLYSFPEQRVIDASDRFEGASRRDVNHDWNASVRATGKARFGPVRRLRGGIRGAYAWTKSNQNSYNVSDSRFFSRYYDYREWRVSPNAAAYIANPSRGRDPIQASVSWDMTRRIYPNRVVQDASGAYGSDRIATTSYSLGVNMNWPLSKYLSVIASYRSSAYFSNMTFERFSTYNYSGQTYLVGFGYEL